MVAALLAVIVGSTRLPAPVIQEPGSTATFSAATNGRTLETTHGTTVASQASPAASAIPGTWLDSAAQAAAIASLLAAQDGVIGVVMIGTDGEPVFAQNADLPFVSASLYKLVLLADIIRRIETGELAGTDQVQLLPEFFGSENGLEDSYFPATWMNEAVPIDTLLFATGAYSSNVAALALRTRTSGGDLQDLARTLGMTGSWFFVDPDTLSDWPPAIPDGVPTETFERTLAYIDLIAADGTVSITTPADIIRFFELLLAGEVVSRDASSQIIEILAQQAIVDRIPSLLPANALVVHKTGNLDRLVHDAGIIWTPDGPVILAALIEDVADEDAAIALIQQIALIAYGQG